MTVRQPTPNIVAIAADTNRRKHRAEPNISKSTTPTVHTPKLLKHLDLFATPDLVMQIARQAERCCNGAPSESAGNNHDPQWSGG